MWTMNIEDLAKILQAAMAEAERTSNTNMMSKIESMGHELDRITLDRRTISTRIALVGRP
jgi:hypothetical protein